MPHVFRLTPFNTSEPVYVVGYECKDIRNPDHLSCDIGFTTMQWGETVHAVESGTIVAIIRGSTCLSPIISPTRADSKHNSRKPSGCLNANLITIKGDDGFFTEYVHVSTFDHLSVGERVRAGIPLGEVDNSAVTSGPHVHLTRYKANPDPKNIDDIRYHKFGRTCDWTISSKDNFFPSTTKGWQQTTNGDWYYFRDNDFNIGKPQIGGWPLGANNVHYELNSSTGAWTGWAFLKGKGYFRSTLAPCPF